MRHSFTDEILAILTRQYGSLAPQVFENSALLQYLNIKTRSATQGSKARGAFANHYGLYVLVEDYIHKGFSGERAGQYEHYEGARFSDLFHRQRELPFGQKLQNHALNSRLNDEFTKYFPTLDRHPVIRDHQTQRYWINESLLQVPVIEHGQEITVNIAGAIIAIIDKYVETKRVAFKEFLHALTQIAALPQSNAVDALEFIKNSLQPTVDARIFEIISYAILKVHYAGQSIFWGWSPEALQQEYLMLYKTGRTNANDGGIDFVMKPLGRFFQVTETTDVNKYFLDIDKIHRFPITFVVKSSQDPESIRDLIKKQAKRRYAVDTVVTRYLEAIEEIINVPMLVSIFETLVEAGQLDKMMNEIVHQSRVEFNYPDDDGEG